jgi:hypothetical protein
VAYALVLRAPSVTLPNDPLGLRRFQTPEIAPNVRLAQTFTMPADSLRAVEVSPASPRRSVSGAVRLELYDVTVEQEPRPLLRAAEVEAAALVTGQSYIFEFEPILDSKDRVYRLDFVSSETRPPQGVALWATKGERYDGGALFINGTRRWADLTFRTHAAAPSIWRLLMTLRETNPIRAQLVLAAFAAVWLLSGLAAGVLAGLPGRAAASGPGAPGAMGPRSGYSGW